MQADKRGGSAQFTGTGVSLNANFTTTAQPGVKSYVFVAVGISTATNTVTGITAGTGTFVRVAQIASAARKLELWVGYNFGTSYPTSLTVARDAGTANMGFVYWTVDVDADTTVAPSFTASAGNTATSTSADSNTLTPAVGDILFAGTVLASITADSTARTHTGNPYWNNTGSELTNMRVEAGWSVASAAASSKEQWTIGSTEWASIQAMFTPAVAPAAAAALLIKGLTTSSADIGSAF